MILFTVLDLGHSKKIIQTFGDAFATARAEGVFLVRGTGQKYRVKWTSLTEELISEYGANHRIFQDPSKERAQKKPKIHGPQLLSPNADPPALPVSDMVDVLEHFPSSDVISAAEAEDPQFLGISSVHVGNDDLRMAPSFNCPDPRVPGLIFSNIVFIAFVPILE